VGGGGVVGCVCGCGVGGGVSRRKNTSARAERMGGRYVASFSLKNMKKFIDGAEKSEMPGRGRGNTKSLQRRQGRTRGKVHTKRCGCRWANYRWV